MAFAVDKNKIAKNTAALYLRMGLTMIIGFFTTRIMLEQLGSEDYGLNNLVGSVVSLMGFISASMGTAVQRFYSIEIGKENEGNLGKVFSTGLYLHVVVAAVSLAIAEVFAVFFLSKLNIPPERIFAAHVVFQISLASMVIGIISVPYLSLLRAREMFSKMAVYDIAQAVLRFLVILLLTVISYDKLIALSFLNFGITVLYTFVMVKMAWQFQETHHRPRRYKELVRQMMTFVSMLLVTVLANLVNTKGIVILINLFFGLVVNAAYAVAVQVQGIVNTFVMNFKQSIVPQMMSAYGAGDLKNMHRLITIGTKITFLLMLVVSLPIVFEAHFLLDIWLKEPPQYAAELVALVIININISSFTYFLYQGVHATGKIVKQQVWMSATYITGIVLTYIAFKMGFSFYSAMIIAMLISLVQCLVNVIFARLNYDYSIKHFLAVILRCLLCAVICAGIMIVIVKALPDGWLRFFIVGGFSVISVGVFGLLLILTGEERKAVRTFIPFGRTR